MKLHSKLVLVGMLLLFGLLTDLGLEPAFANHDVSAPNGAEFIDNAELAGAEFID